MNLKDKIRLQQAQVSLQRNQITQEQYDQIAAECQGETPAAAPKPSAPKTPKAPKAPKTPEAPKKGKGRGKATAVTTTEPSAEPDASTTAENGEGGHGQTDEDSDPGNE